MDRPVHRNVANGQRSPSRDPEVSQQQSGQKSADSNGGLFGSLIEWDVAVTSKLGLCVDKSAPLGHLRPLMKVLEISCHGIPWFVFVIAAIFAAHRVKTLELLMNLLMALIVDCLIIAMLKLIVRRKRPAHNQMDMFVTMSIDNHSFPSGHTTRAVLLALFFARHLAVPRLAEAALLVWSVAVCISRVLLGRHHVLDVLCGVLVGYLEFLIVEALWVDPDTCMALLRPIHEETHL